MVTMKDTKDRGVSLEAAFASMMPQGPEASPCGRTLKRMSEYKSVGTRKSQAERRNRVLERIRKTRDARLASTTDVETFLDGPVGDNDCDRERMDADESPMATVTNFQSSPRTHVPSAKKKDRRYRNAIMMSEFMEEVPADIASKWSTVVCPVGKRCLIVARMGCTHMYLRNGYMMKMFNTTLPGGDETESNKKMAWLDCIFDEDTSVFYVVDILDWNGFPVVDNERKFRTFWLASKFAELDAPSKRHRFRFEVLPSYECTESGLNEAEECGRRLGPRLDGYLMFHNEGIYERGRTPLCLWLTAAMLDGASLSSLLTLNKVGVSPCSSMEGVETGESSSKENAK